MIIMPRSAETDKVENFEFKWGKKSGVGRKKKEVQYYESFTYDGMEYTLYDCVYMYKEGVPEPYIGKLIRIWTDKTKKVMVQWFFRPSEILSWLGDEEPLENEIFLASGEGVGLVDVNSLEAIAGKCNVVCTSKDSRNPQPSLDELQLADYIFYRTFDVGQCKILDTIADKVAGVEVKFIFNKKESETTSLVPKLDSVACKERVQISEKNPSYEFKTPNIDGNSSSLVVKEDTDVKDSLVKPIPTSSVEKGSVSNDKRLASYITDPEGNMFKIEEKCKSAEDSGALDDRPSKKARVDNFAKESDDKNLNSDKILTNQRNDVKASIKSVTPSEKKAKSGSVNDLHGQDRRIKSLKDSGSLKSVAPTEEKTKSGSVKDLHGQDKSIKSPKDSGSFKSVAPTEEKAKSGSVKDLHGQDKSIKSPKDSGSFKSVTPSEEKAKSGSVKDLHGQDRSIKSHKDSGSFKSVAPSEEKAKSGSVKDLHGQDRSIKSPKDSGSFKSVAPSEEKAKSGSVKDLHGQDKSIKSPKDSGSFKSVTPTEEKTKSGSVKDLHEQDKSIKSPIDSGSLKSVTPSEEKAKSGSVKDLHGLDKSVKSPKDSGSFKSVIRSEEKAKYGSVKDLHGQDKSIKSPKNLDSFRSVTPIEEKTKSGSVKDLHGQDKSVKSHKDLGSFKSVNPSEEKTKFGSVKDLHGQGKSIESPKDLGSFKSVTPTEEKTKSGSVKDLHGQDKSIKSPKDSGSLEDKPFKKPRVDSSTKLPDNKNKSSVHTLSINSDGNDAKTKSKLANHSFGREPDPEPDEKIAKVSNGKLLKAPSEKFSDEDIRSEGRGIEVTRRPDTDKGKRFRELPWEEIIVSAHEKGTLVLFQNLDPNYTSAEVEEDIIWRGLNESCSAKMVQRTAISSPHSGQAFGIFETREAAERVVRKLNEGCLMLNNGRPLLGSISPPHSLSGKHSTFFGHLSIDKAKLPMQRELKEAVSHSHYSEPDTIEFEMAMEWCLLQARSESSWKRLYKLQGEELRKLKANLKRK